jgi:hypothetical protein
MEKMGIEIPRSSIEKLEVLPLDRSQVYEHPIFGLRVRIPAEWNIRKSGPFDNKKMFVLIEDTSSDDPLNIGNFLITMEPATEKPLHCTIPDLASGKEDKQLVKIAGDMSFLAGPTDGPIFGFVSRSSGYASGYSYSFCTSQNGYYIYGSAQYASTDWDPFLTFLMGVEFFPPTQQLGHTSETVVDSLCNITIHKPAHWDYFKNGLCLLDGVEDQIRSPKSGSIYISQHLDPEQMGEPLEKFAISGFPAERFKGLSDDWEFDFPEYIIVVDLPKKDLFFSINLANSSDSSGLAELMEVVGNVEIVP